MSDIDALLAAQAQGATDPLDALLHQQANAAPQPVIPKPAPVEPPSFLESLLAKVPYGAANNGLLTRLRGLAMGAADPVVGTAQLAANVLPSGISDTVNNAIAAKDKAYQAERGPDAGFDGARLLGNVASPVNLLGAGAVNTAATLPGRIAQGAAIGAVGGATSPVEDGGDHYWGQKAAQTGIGAVGGAVVGPLANAISNKVTNYIASKSYNPATANAQTDTLIQNALAEVNQRIEDIPRVQLDALRTQVSTALQTGKKLDPAALLRKSDFDAAGIPHTLGQITRDPMQWATEKNLRGVRGVGEPLTALMDTGNQKLQQGVGQYASGASESFPAGEKLATALKAYDTGLKSNVSDLYAAARASAGKDLDVPLQGFAQDYANVLHEFGDKVPSGVKNVLNDYGLAGGTQNKVFTVESADKVLKVINANQSNDPATNAALAQLRTAVKSAVTSADASGGVFAPAVKAAADRFKLQDAIPALEAAANGAPADKFVERFVINGKVNDVKGLADVLKKASPDAFDEARKQIGATLQRAAFGENVAGDKAFAPEQYAKALRNIGTDKLNAFFTEAEVDGLKRLGRIGAYQNSVPSVSAPNFSNSASAFGNLLSKGGGALADAIPGGKLAAGLVNAAKTTADNNSLVRNAMAAKVPINNITPDQASILAKLLAAGAGGAGLALAPTFRPGTFGMKQ